MGQLVYCGAKGEVTIGNSKPNSKKPEGTVTSSMEEKPTIALARRAHLLCFIGRYSDDGCEKRVHLFCGKSQDPDVDIPRDCWNCRVYSNVGSVVMRIGIVAMLVSVTVAIRVQLTRVSSTEVWTLLEVDTWTSQS